MVDQQNQSRQRDQADLPVDKTQARVGGKPVGVPSAAQGGKSQQAQSSAPQSQSVNQPVVAAGKAQQPGYQPQYPTQTPAAQSKGAVSPVQVQPPVQTVVSPSPTRVVAPVPTETAVEFQDRMVKSEQMKEVKRVKRTYKVENAVSVLFGTIEASLAIRLIFKLLGASSGNAFVNILYQFTGIFANPFSGIFGGNPAFGRFELDLASIIAMVIYAIVGFGVLQLAKLL